MSGDALVLGEIHDKVVEIHSKLSYLLRLLNNITFRRGDHSDSNYVDNMLEIIEDITYENNPYCQLARIPLQKLKDHIGSLVKEEKYTQTLGIREDAASYERNINFLLSTQSFNCRPIDRNSPVLYSPFEWWTFLMILQDKIIPEIFEPLEMSGPFNFTILPEGRPYDVGVGVLGLKIYLHDDSTMNIHAPMIMQLDYEKQEMHFFVNFQSSPKFDEWDSRYNGKTIRVMKDLLLKEIMETNELIFKNLQTLDAYSEGLGYPIAVKLSNDWQ